MSVLLGCALGSRSGAPAHTPTHYTLTDLGTLGGTYSAARALNAAGQVVGVSYTTENQAQHAFLWQNNKMTDLGTLPDGSLSEALGINSKGAIVGKATVEHSARPCLWENGVPTDLTPEKNRDGRAFAINTAGLIVGESAAGTNVRFAFWQDGKRREMGALDNGSSSARALNERGQVVGVTSTKAGSRAFLWSDRKMLDLGTLGGNLSYAFAINENGQVVGFAENASGAQHAFLWQNSKMTDLGTLGGRSSMAYGVNGSGAVVGTSDLPDNQSSHAFLWQNGKMTDLNTLIPPNSGLTLNSAAAINARGQIVGEGRLQNQTHAFLLTPAH